MLRLLTLLALVSTSVAVSAKEHVALLGTYTGAESRGIYVVRLNAETGELSTPQLAAEAANPAFLALHPNGRVVYAINESNTIKGGRGGAVSSFTVEPSTGQLTKLNSESTGSSSLAHVAVDSTGRMVAAASYGGGYTVAFPLDAIGRLQPHSGLLRHEGPLGPQSDRQDKPHAHSVTFSPDNRFAMVADLGLDRVLIFRADVAAGTLAPNDPAFAALAPGAGPRHSKFSADGKFFYVINELDATITAFRHDIAAGTLNPFQTISTLPPDYTGRKSTAEIRIHPNGRFVYGSNRGHNSLAVFGVDNATGELTRIENVPTGGEIPRNFELTPDGAWLLCANQDSNNLTVFRVDANTGRLTSTPHTATVSKAVCVLFLN